MFVPCPVLSNVMSFSCYKIVLGWCSDEADCLTRSRTSLGSSSTWEQTLSYEGIMSDSCFVNPDFCNYNRVAMKYCDGNSFSSDRELVVNGTRLYMRGRRILDAVFRTLFKIGLAAAKNVLLTGCSAGGLATYLHADYGVILLLLSLYELLLFCVFFNIGKVFIIWNFIYLYFALMFNIYSWFSTAPGCKCNTI